MTMVQAVADLIGLGVAVGEEDFLNVEVFHVVGVERSNVAEVQQGVSLTHAGEAVEDYKAEAGVQHLEAEMPAAVVKILEVIAVAYHEVPPTVEDVAVVAEEDRPTQSNFDSKTKIHTPMYGLSRKMSKGASGLSHVDGIPAFWLCTHSVYSLS